MPSQWKPTPRDLWTAERQDMVAKMTAERQEMVAKKDRQAAVKVAFASIIAGLVGAVIAALGPAVVERFENRDTISPDMAEGAGCVEGSGDAVEGEQYLRVLLSKQGDNCWRAGLNGAKGDDSVDVLMQWRNWTGTQVDDVTIAAVLGDAYDYQPGSARWFSAGEPDGVEAPDDLFAGGINIGSYGDGANAYVLFTVRLDADFTPECGLQAQPVYALLPATKDVPDTWSTAVALTDRRC